MCVSGATDSYLWHDSLMFVCMASRSVQLHSFSISMEGKTLILCSYMQTRNMSDVEIDEVLWRITPWIVALTLLAYDACAVLCMCVCIVLSLSLSLSLSLHIYVLISIGSRAKQACTQWIRIDCDTRKENKWRSHLASRYADTLIDSSTNVHTCRAWWATTCMQARTCRAVCTRTRRMEACTALRTSNRIWTTHCNTLQHTATQHQC